VLLNQPGRTRVHIKVPAGATDMDGTTVEHLSLGGSEAKILQADCVTPVD